ncbi:MAG: hypothetical protein IPK13_23645 [Deltaproteobacteria bacterium]|nr:hypothetical protein [Deltaproteobacteria bacterium]
MRSPNQTWWLLAFLAGAAFLSRLVAIQDPDIPWHLLHARFVLEQRSTTYADFVSFTVPGRIYHNQPWLGELILLGFYQLSGSAGLVLYTSLAAVGGVLATHRLASLTSHRAPWLTLLVTALVAGATNWRLEPRPMALFPILLAVAMYIAARFADPWGSASGTLIPNHPAGTRPNDRRTATRWAAAAILLFIAWAQIHGSYVLFPAILGIAVVGKAPSLGTQRTAWRLLLPALFGVYCLFQSEHVALVSRVALGDATNHIAEMRPLQLSQLIPTYLNSVLCLDALLIVAVVRSIRARRVRASDLAYAVLGFALALTAHRFRAAWAVLLVPWASRAYASELFAARHALPEPAWLRRLAATLAIATIPVIVVGMIDRNPERTFSVDFNRDIYPADTTDLLKAHRVEGNLFNVYDDGGYLSFSLYPKVRIAIDGRTPTVFDDELYFLIRSTPNSEAAFDGFAETYKPDMALIPSSAPMCARLAKRPDWRPVYFDHLRTLFFRTPFRADLHTISTINACDPLTSIEDTCRSPAQESVLRLGAELNRLLQLAPDAPAIHIARARFERMCAHDAQRARAFADAALDSGTRRASAYFEAALARAAAQDLEAALEAADLAVYLGGGPHAAHLHALLLKDTGDLFRARDELLALEKSAKDDMPTSARVDLAEILLKTGDPTLARLQAQRAYWISRDTRAKMLLTELGVAPSTPSQPL